MGLGVTHPKLPTRHPGPSCHVWVWLGCPQSSHSLSISPSATHPIRCTPEVGVCGELQGFPLPEWAPRLLRGDPMGTTGSLSESWLWHSHMPQACQLAGEFPDTLGPSSHECSPPLALLRVSRGAQLPLGLPAVGPPSPSPRRRCRPPAAVVPGTSDRFYGFWEKEAAWQEAERKHRPCRSPPPTLLAALPPTAPCTLSCTPPCTLALQGGLPHPHEGFRGCLVQRGACPVEPSPQERVRPSGDIIPKSPLCRMLGGASPKAPTCGDAGGQWCL